MIDLQQGRGIYEVRISRRVTRPELDGLKRQFDGVVPDEHATRVLCRLGEFWGFDSAALWDDLRHWLRYLDPPARVAIVAERKWIDLLADSEFEPPSIEMRGFDSADEAAALRWLGPTSSEGSATDVTPAFGRSRRGRGRTAPTR